MKYSLFLFCSWLIIEVRLVADGAIEGAIKKVSPFESQPYNITKIGIIIFALLLLIFILFFRNRNLSRRVQTQTKEMESYQAHLVKMADEAAMDSCEREFETINCLVSAIEYRDIETANHITRMAYYSRLIAKGIFAEDSPMVGLIFLAAPMHDVGKIGISDSILSKPQRLNNKEFQEMKRHTWMGYDILKNGSSEVIKLGATIALTHHERYDGSGYPRGLKGNQIPIAGRIVAVADYLDALVSKRVYKKAWSLKRAIADIKAHSGTYFDPVCVDALLENLDDILEIKNSYPDSTGNTA